MKAADDRKTVRCFFFRFQEKCARILLFGFPVPSSFLHNTFRNEKIHRLPQNESRGAEIPVSGLSAPHNPVIGSFDELDEGGS